jgi:hypothetical protein
MSFFASAAVAGLDRGTINAAVHVLVPAAHAVSPVTTTAAPALTLAIRVDRRFNATTAQIDGDIAAASIAVVSTAADKLAD